MSRAEAISPDEDWRRSCSTRKTSFMISESHDSKMMHLALELAHEAATDGEAPVGAVLCDADGLVVAKARNSPIATTDPTAHAEILALREGARTLGNYRLTGTTLYVTLEPCAMCAGAISHARVARLVIAARDSKGGAVWHGPKFFDQPTCHSRPKVLQGPFADEAGQVLKDFFRARR